MIDKVIWEIYEVFQKIVWNDFPQKPDDYAGDDCSAECMKMLYDQMRNFTKFVCQTKFFKLSHDVWYHT